MVQIFNWETTGGDFFDPLEEIVEDVVVPKREDVRNPYDWKYRHPKEEWLPQYRRDGTKYYIPINK